MPRYRHPSLPGSPATERITLWLPKAERDNIRRLARDAEPMMLDPAKALEGLRLSRERGAHLKRDFEDADLWLELAHKRGIKLPQWHTPATPRKMSAWLRRLGIDRRTYIEWSGEKTLKDNARLSPQC